VKTREHPENNRGANPYSNIGGETAKSLPLCKIVPKLHFNKSGTGRIAWARA